MLTLGDDELGRTDGRHRHGADGLDGRQRRRLAPQPGEKCGGVASAAFDFNDHTARVVADAAAEPQLRRQRVDERAQADTLHDAVDEHPAPHVAFSDACDVSRSSSVHASRSALLWGEG